jgi:cell cycle sensor histidine kinase DivJ
LRAALKSARARAFAGWFAALVAAPCVAVAAPMTEAPAKWTSSLAIAAAIGGMLAMRRAGGQAPGDSAGDSALKTLAGDCLARHRIDGRVTGIEGEGLARLALAGPDLMGYGLVDRLSADDRPRFLEALRATAQDGQARTTQVRLRCAGSDAFAPAELKSCALEDGGMVTAIRDAGAVLDLAAQLEAAREEARLEKSLKDRLLANMSHELRTPLNAILGFSEILGDPELAPADPGKRQEYARIIHASADHLLSVVNLVLDMSRIEAGKFSIAPEPLELQPLIQECADMLRLRAERGNVRLVLGPLLEGLEIVADKGACRQILVNLLSNAVKFTPPQGSVTIDARIEAGEARISVTDTGIGVKADDLSRLGDPFFQVKSGYNRSFEGAGLGLSLVRGLVGLHDGSLILESEIGVGTRVTAVLPLEARPAPRRVTSARLHTIARMNPPPVVAAEEERRIA